VIYRDVLERDVISALSNRDARGKAGFVPFRNSKLTHLLQVSFEI